jgi:hypothetical protein
MKLNEIIDLESNPITDEGFREQCRKTLEVNGVILLTDFLSTEALEAIRGEGEAKKDLAYFTNSKHNIYISDPDPKYPDDHIRNILVTSSKGCITDDKIDADSPLRTLYDHPKFRKFLATVLREEALYEFADDYSSINLHYADEGQELGWHFDNSSFATTLLIQKPMDGGVFEYQRDTRNAEKQEMNFELVEKILNGESKVNTLSQEPGTLALFRGRNAIHRVTPTKGNVTRMLVVLAYNSEPGIALSASATKTFYGK